jgi:hypothetical protein
VRGYASAGDFLLDLHLPARRASICNKRWRGVATGCR